MSTKQNNIFQSTLPREERLRCSSSVGSSGIFQSTLPREERPFPVLIIDSVLYFNPRSHERSDNPLSVLCSLAIIFQSTLPREERLQCAYSHPLRFTFQSTLPREERLRADRVFKTLLYFNPRSHERSDDQDQDQEYQCHISIHAPTRGATVLSAITCLPTNFNPRSHERSDGVKCNHLFTYKFQSTLPREERRYLR